jgi:hypothetical protein
MRVAAARNRLQAEASSSAHLSLAAFLCGGAASDDGAPGSPAAVARAGLRHGRTEPGPGAFAGAGDAAAAEAETELPGRRCASDHAEHLRRAAAAGAAAAGQPQQPQAQQQAQAQQQQQQQQAQQQPRARSRLREASLPEAPAAAAATAPGGCCKGGSGGGEGTDGEQPGTPGADDERSPVARLASACSGASLTAACAPGGGGGGDGAGGDPWKRRRARLEADRAARDLEVREFQRRHWAEMRAAAARNRAAVLGEVAAPPSSSGDGGGGEGGEEATAQGFSEARRAAPAEAEGGPAGRAEGEQGGAGGGAGTGGNFGVTEFAAMVADMCSVAAAAPGGGSGGDDEDGTSDCGGDGPAPEGSPAPVGQSAEGRACGAEPSDAEAGGSQAEGEAEGGGSSVSPPPGRAGDGLALRADALRRFLEEQLGPELFDRWGLGLGALGFGDVRGCTGGQAAESARDLAGALHSRNAPAPLPTPSLYRRLEAAAPPGGPAAAGAVAAAAGAPGGAASSGAEPSVGLLGRGAGYLNLIHQLIACEEAAAAGP